MPHSALEGLHVLDLTHYVAGPFATKLLADFGAEVIKLEKPPIGDPARNIGPFYKDDPAIETSGLFLHLNTNKRSITLNLQGESGKEIFRQLIIWADVMVENFSPTTLPSMGLTFDEISSWNPKLVMVSISNFGQYGPYRDYKSEDIVAYGMGGPMLMTGIDEMEPSKLGLNVILYHSGLVAALAAMTAVTTVELGGHGHHIDVSIFETQVGTQDRRMSAMIGYQHTGDTFSRTPFNTFIATGAKPCTDGFLSLSGGGMRLDRIAKMLGRPDLLEDPRFASREAQRRPENAEAFDDELLLPWLQHRTSRQAWSDAQSFGVLSGPVLTIDQVLEDPHFKAREMWVELDHPIVGRLSYPGRPFIMGTTPSLLSKPVGSQNPLPAPTLGEHNVSVLCELLGYSRSDLVRLRSCGVI